MYRTATTSTAYHYYSYAYNELAQSGPGGTVTYINFYRYFPWYYMTYHYDYSQYITKLVRRGSYSYYARSWYKDITGGGRNLVWGQLWCPYMTVYGGAGVNGLLRNLIEIANPDAL